MFEITKMGHNSCINISVRKQLYFIYNNRCYCDIEVKSSVKFISIDLSRYRMVTFPENCENTILSSKLTIFLWTQIIVHLFCPLIIFGRAHNFPRTILCILDKINTYVETIPLKSRIFWHSSAIIMYTYQFFSKQ